MLYWQTDEIDKEEKAMMVQAMERKTEVRLLRWVRSDGDQVIESQN
jgi:hypothetical protein